VATTLGYKKTSMRTHLEPLENFFHSSREVSQIIGVNPAQLTRWHRQAKPDPENERKVLGLKYIVDELMSYFEHPSTAKKWLLGDNAFLNHARPIDLIHQGKFTDVLLAIDQMIAGDYA
jgi:uncharacterized protein (DUF2384 family)